MRQAPPAPLPARRASFDLLKVVCCLSIILLHAITARVEKVDASASWLLADLLSSATREAVPVFFMISGALLLRKDIPSYKEYFLKVFTNYAIPLFGGLVAYKMLAMDQGDATSIFNTVFYNFEKNIGFHLWFMWTFLGLALVTPLLRPIVAGAKTMSLFLALWFVFCIAQPWLLAAGVKIPVANMLFMLFTGYFVLGYCISVSTVRFNTSLLISGIFVSILNTALLTALASRDALVLNPIFYEGQSPWLLLCSACMLKLFLQRFPGPSTPLLRTLSGATFTIYIYHVIALSYVTRFIGPTSLAMSVFVHTPAAFAACTLLYLAARRIPYVRAFFRG